VDPLPPWLLEAHEEYLLSQAWPGGVPDDLSWKQVVAGAHIHGLYEQLRDEREAKRMKQMFGG
jgi:hypothetical protein